MIGVNRMSKNKDIKYLHSDQVIYWILLNDDRYFGAETFQEAQRLITIFRLMGCPDKLEIEADCEGDQ